MKKDIHPKYFQTKITCACGNVLETGSTAENIEVEICSACHPFYTGKGKIIDTAGRVEKFNLRAAKVSEFKKMKKKERKSNKKEANKNQ